MTTFDYQPAISDGPPAYPMARHCPLDPPEEIGILRAERPVTRVKIWDGTEPWLVTRYEDVRDVLADPRFSADFSLPGYPGSSLAVKISRETSPWFVNMDDPDHARYRRMLTGEFAVRRVEAFRPMVEETVNDLLAEMAALPQPVDLVSAFALAVHRWSPAGYSAYRTRIVFSGSSVVTRYSTSPRVPRLAGARTVSSGATWPM